MPRQSAPPRRNIICAGQFEATATGQLCRWTYQWNAQHHPICTAFQCRLRSFGPVIQQLGALLPCHFFACQHRLNPSHPGLLSFCFLMLLLEDAGGTDLLFKNAKTKYHKCKTSIKPRHDFLLLHLTNSSCKAWCVPLSITLAKVLMRAFRACSSAGSRPWKWRPTTKTWQGAEEPDMTYTNRLSGYT